MSRFLKSYPVIFLLFFLTLPPVFGQSDEQLKELKKAEQSYKNGDYADALRGFLPLLESFDSSAIVQYGLNFKIGFCYYASAPEDSFAVPFFRKYLESSQVNFEAYYFLGNISSANHEFDSAIYFFSKFSAAVAENTELSNSGLSEQIIEIARRQIAKCEFGKFLITHPGCANIESASGGVNTTYSEYGPGISPDETLLAFTRRSPETLGGRISDDGDFFEDIYFARMNRTTIPLETDSFGNAIGDATIEMILFSPPVNIGQKMNTEGHEGAIQFSADGNKFFIYRKSNILVSKKKKKDSPYLTRNWNKVKRQNQIKGVFIPKTYEPSVSISPDENTIYFSSERPGGFGGLDIYKSERGSDGKWSAALNLGETINTVSDEDAPFIAQDGKTLYFSSKGHENMGDYDIFISENNGEQWTKPLNLGYPVNSASDDIFYTVSAQSGTGYFSSDRFNGLGLMDIYKASFPSDINASARVIGTIADSDSQPAFTNISLIDNDYPEDSVIISTDSATGQFSTALAFNKTYLLKIYDSKYEPFTDTLIVPGLKFFCQQYSDTLTINLQRVEIDTIPVLDSVLISSEDSMAKLIQDSIAIADSLSRLRTTEALEKIIKSEKKAKTEKMPETFGILFRVQVGAYKNPLSKNVFEKIPDLQAIPFEDGFTRYFSGSFGTMKEARERKEEIVKEGYADAFIVAFKDGIKIPLKDALSK